MPTGRKAQISELAETPLEGIDNFLQLVEPPMRNPLEETDVVIAVKSSAINWVDLLMTSGQYQHQPPLPYTAGLEYGGEVLWMGKKASESTIKVGDKVMVLGCPSVIAAQKNPAIRTERVKDIFQWVRAGKIVPYVSHTFPLSDIKKALKAKWNGQIIGGGAVRPD